MVVKNLGWKNDNPVRKTTLEVAKRAKHVKINQEKIAELAEKWAKENIKVPLRRAEDILDIKDERKILDYLFILDTLNFCFWSLREKWTIEFGGRKIGGYFGFSLALKKFFEEKPEQAELNNIIKISYKDFCDIFKGKGELQFLKKRWQMARETSRVLAKKYNGDSRKFVKSANHKFYLFVPMVIRELTSFNDVARYEGKKIYLLKRAQILAADISFAFGNKGIGYFEDLDYLTAMPDYKLPQILRHYGILSYSHELDNKIKNRVLLLAGKKKEVEIRAATVWAVEYLKEELAKRGKNFYSFELDWILWDKSQSEKIEEPYHLVKSIFY
jgi:hypothetical protein